MERLEYFCKRPEGYSGRCRGNPENVSLVACVVIMLHRQTLQLFHDQRRSPLVFRQENFDGSKTLKIQPQLNSRISVTRQSLID
ncbi:hypothetical protein [Leptolyngbya sp. PCC 6406]|uniref:hypothetical protein n=1 Tax=Leptolyngbya sp. PCC 6406 TaxID=1173264 RepID=UPI0002ACC3F5|nr:hypothetical protein [Leptolyngbya sp. PCC 6406]